MCRVFVVFASLLVTFPLAAQTPGRHYDSNGHYLGETRQEGSRLVERDHDGRKKGYYETEGSKMIHRDSDGRRLGYTTK